MEGKSFDLNIMGTDYTVKFRTIEQHPKFKDATGLAELYSKELYIKTGYENEPEAYDNVIEYRENVLRHEIFHAIFHECGLNKYMEDEMLVEFLALQWGKIERIMKEAHRKHEEVKM